MSRRTKLILASIALSFLFLIWWTNPTIAKFGTIKIYDRHGKLLYESSQGVGSKQPIGYAQLPQSFIDATVATEDETFWHNPGVDLKAIVRSLWLNVRRQEIVSGASTITQQVARAAIIAPNARADRSILRKIREGLIALRLRALYSKQDIFELYSNTVYFGNQTYGVQAAAQLYFAKDATNLSLAESAFLAGLLASPEARNPYTNFEHSKQAQKQTLTRMLDEGFIDQEVFDSAIAEPLTIVPPRTQATAPHFVQAVLATIEELGIDTHQGLSVTTTLDLPTYQLSETVARRVVANLAQQHDLSNAAVVVLENQTGQVISMVGGVDFTDATHSGQVNMAAALRQPGSALKPVTYARAFMQGETAATVLADIPQVFPTKSGEGFAPNNYDGKFRGPVLARTALASSLNVPAVEMLQHIGVPALIQQSRDMGITSFTQPDRYDLALTLGGGEVRLIELTNAYATFARGGEFIPTQLIMTITSDAGESVYQAPATQPTQVLGEHGASIAYLITDILADPKARLPGFGERSPLALSVPAAVKTGTTTDWHDNWTIGYTPSYTVGVWVGNNDNHPMIKISGVVGAAPIWQQFFEEFLKDKRSEQFVRPPEIIEQEICGETGLLATATCSSTRRELFLQGTQPTDEGSFRITVPIDIRNGMRAGAACPQQFVKEQLRWQFPAKYYSWARAEGLPLVPTDWSLFCPDTDNNIGNDIRDRDAMDATNQTIVITSPKQQAVFESAPQLVNNQSLLLEAQVSPKVRRVTWYIDGTVVGASDAFPFSTSWSLAIGEHTVSAQATLENGQIQASQPISFTVVAYKADPNY